MAPLSALAGRRVLLTGATGFKGAWIGLGLRRAGARVVSFSLDPHPGSLFARADLARSLGWTRVDLRDGAAVAAAVAAADPELVLHLAGQARVDEAHRDPLGTFEVNALGVARLLAALPDAPCGVIVATTDKVYGGGPPPGALRGQPAWAEGDPLLADDPYGASKVAAEAAVAALRAARFPLRALDRHGVVLATVRCGNVFGADDPTPGRLVPDCLAAFAAGRPVGLRAPGGVRPWLHVLDAAAGYLRLGAALLPGAADRGALSGAHHLAPEPEAAVPVQVLVDALAAAWGPGARSRPAPADLPEAARLVLQPGAAAGALGWAPRLPLPAAAARAAAGARPPADGGLWAAALQRQAAGALGIEPLLGLAVDLEAAELAGLAAEEALRRAHLELACAAGAFPEPALQPLLDEVLR